MASSNGAGVNADGQASTTTPSSTPRLSHDTSDPSVLPIPSLSRNPSLVQALQSLAALQTRKNADDKVIRIGTRASVLALVQAKTVLIQLEAKFGSKGYTFELAPMSTAGDRNTTQALYLMGSKALWTKDLEVALNEGLVDCIVHSLKDVPTTLPEGMQLAAILEREDPRDAFVAKAGSSYKSLDDLPDGSCVGSSSVRRVAQMKRKYPNLVFKDVRGNIGTRLGKLDADDGVYDALILASAGLNRLDMQDRITSYISSPTMLHAVGQGAIGVEVMSSNQAMVEMIGSLNHTETDWRTTCERTMLKVLEGGCSVPVGVETTFADPPQASSSSRSGDDIDPSAATSSPKRLHIRAVIVSLDGQTCIEHEETRPISSNQDAADLGHDVAVKLIEQGGKAILEELGRIVEAKNIKGVNTEVAKEQVKEELQAQPQA